MKNRDELIEYIKSLEGVKINRLRKDRISVKSSLFKDDKPLVLKGDIYEENRDYSDYSREYNATINRDPGVTERTLRTLKSDFTEGIRRRTERNKKRYKNAQSKSKQENRSIIQQKNKDIKLINYEADNHITSFKSFLSVIIIALVIMRK